MFKSNVYGQYFRTESPWNCTIWTSDMKYAGTDAKVYIQVGSIYNKYENKALYSCICCYQKKYC